MTPEEVEQARETLGKAWGLKRPLYRSELARAAGLTSRFAHRRVRDWEEGRYSPSPSAVQVIAMLLGGADPPGGLDAILLRREASRAGGLARAASLTAERRQQIAASGAEAAKARRRS